jgi:hypothetical protein
MSNEFDFSSLEEIRIPVVGPDGLRYVLCEASGEAAVQFNNFRASCVRFTDGKLSSVKGPGAGEALLVSLCLFPAKVETSEDGEEKWEPLKTIAGQNGRDQLNNIDQAVIRSWPSKIQKKLFDRALKISEIDETNDLEGLKKQRDDLNKQIAEMEKEGGNS